MEQNWKLGLFVGVVVMCFLCQSFHWSWCLNDEGLALLRFRERVVSDPLGALSNWKEEDVEVDPCSWFGVACSEGKVVVLNVDQTEGTVSRRLREKKTPPKSPSYHRAPTPYHGPSAPSYRSRNGPSASSYYRPNPARPPSSSQTPPSTPIAPPPSSPSSLVPPSTTLSQRRSSSNHRIVAILAGAIGGTILILVIGVYLCIINKVATVKPWATGLSGQLQKAFVTGVPKIKRSELEAACEDFSNVIGSTPIGTVYKGTLSSGVEIAVASVAATSGKGWLNSLEARFIKKIDILSKVNHKNFVNLLGYCQEDKPFTRMMVFEYAPNGTLFEHLHIKEAEHLDWEMRLRIAMGMAYCLEHMHQLNPPIAHNNLNSSAISLTEDYAAKISEFTFWNEIVAAEIESSGLNTLHTPSACPESNVYSFGVILFEIVTGRLPYSVGNASLEDWAFAYLSGEEPLREMVDPTLTSFQEDQLELIGEVLKSCVHPDSRHRPAMREVCARLSTITGITPEAANPKLSPLWWAELEITSANAS